MNARPAKAADLDAVLRIEGAWATTAHWTRRQFEAELNSPASVFLVVEDGAGVAGFVAARRYGAEVQVLDIAVALPRRGLGRGLIEALKAPGVEILTLEVSGKNPGGRAFYESLGFRVVGSRPKFYNDGADAVLMDLSLR